MLTQSKQFVTHIELISFWLCVKICGHCFICWQS